MNASQSLRWWRPDTNFREIRPERLITLNEERERERERRYFHIKIKIREQKHTLLLLLPLH